MNIWDIAKKIGSAALQVALPGAGSLIIASANEFLPKDKQLPETATGSQLGLALSGLSPDAKAALMFKDFDVEMVQIQETNSTVRAMLESDAKTPHTTRPYIAKQAFHVVAFVTVVVVSAWAYGVIFGKSEIVKAVMDGWQFVLAVVGPLVTLLWAYFGILKQEHKNKLNAANGEVTSGAIEKLIKRFK